MRGRSPGTTEQSVNGARTPRRELHVERGGAGEPLLVLLHGIGANAAVWSRLLPWVERRWPGRWLAPDFRGHGRSPHEPPYGYGDHAADVADLIGAEAAGEVALLGHSFGGLIAALLGSGLFAVPVRRVFGLGIKIVWSEEERARSRTLAAQPPRMFDTRAAALERALKLAGLHGLVDPHAPEAAAGIRETDGRFLVATDMRVMGAAGPPIETLLTLCLAPLRLAAGASDPMVTLEQMRRVDADAVSIDGAGHNAHWQAPEAVWRAFEAALHSG